MKAVVWHGKEDVRVDEVEDPGIREPNDAIVRITSTAICGPDLHLYSKLAPVMHEGEILGHEPMGIVEEVGRDVRRLAAGDRVVIPFNIACGRCFFCRRGLQSQCETTQNKTFKKGGSLFGYTEAYGGVPGARQSTCGSLLQTTAPSRSRRNRRMNAFCTCPTCCPPPGRASGTRRSHPGTPWGSGG